MGWVDELVTIFNGLSRVLTETGSLWLNVGDSYSRGEKYGAPAKSLLLGPARLILRLSADGWIIRNHVVWEKSNPMPSSVRDRLSCTHEAFYLITRSRRPFFDLDAIRVPHKTTKASPVKSSKYSKCPLGPLAGTNDGLLKAKEEGRPGHILGKNPGDVWRLATANFKGEHFATFPESLVEKPIKATCPEAVCTICATPFTRSYGPWRPANRANESPTREIGELRGCSCNAQMRPGLVLDPFMGSGTVALAARRLGRNYLGIEVNGEYVKVAKARLASDDDRLKRAA